MNRSAVGITGSFLALAIAGCGGPPRIGEDREAFKAVDALYTAVGLRDPGLVDRCAGNLTSLRAQSRLPSRASEALESIIDEARRGEWDSAQQRLSTLMEAQRR